MRRRVERASLWKVMMTLVAGKSDEQDTDGQLRREQRGQRAAVRVISGQA